MSITKYLLMILIPVLGIGYFASVSDHTFGFSSGRKSESRSFASKSGALVAVELEAVDHDAAVRGEVFELKAYTVSRTETDTLNIRWILPKGFELVEGSLDSQAHDVIKGARYEHSIKLRTNGDSENLAIFQVRVGDTNVGATRTYSTARAVESETASIVSAFKATSEEKPVKKKLIH